jgi:hypothetical protein
MIGMRPTDRHASAGVDGMGHKLSAWLACSPYGAQRNAGTAVPRGKAAPDCAFGSIRATDGSSPPSHRSRASKQKPAIKLREYGRIAGMADPFGNGFDLIEFSGAGYDAVARGASAN